MHPVDQLCTNCGLCCDSTLFADTELRPEDDAKQLAQLGLTITKKGRRKLAFAQPCACFDGKYCKIYQDRPTQCRLFECGLLKRTGAGKMNVDTALKTISEAKTLANKVRALLRACGLNPEEKALIHSYSEAMSQPIDLSHGDEAAVLHGQLMQAFGDLMKLLEKEFLQ
ncbi:MAG TPA: YkgJ family cysteine cluster protein [Verrucomicrobiae bacterium]|nr:YkgJ family cysteine cluster protein [Verrucomicrobiae bacterium]